MSKSTQWVEVTFIGGSLNGAARHVQAPPVEGDTYTDRTGEVYTYTEAALAFVLLEVVIPRKKDK